MWENYKINVQDNLINDINNFCPVNSTKTNQNAFRTIKNHKQTGVFFRSNQEINIINQDDNKNNEQHVDYLI